MRLRSAGYSLFEVLIAFAIISIVLAALIPGQARLLGRATDSDQQALAFDFALSRAAELGLSTPLQIGRKTSTYRSWSVTQTVTPGAQTVTGQLVNVVIEVQSASGGALARHSTIRIIRDGS